MAKKEQIIVVADPHIHNYSAFNKGNSRLQNCINLIQELIQCAVDRGIDTIVCTGDWFDQSKLAAAVVNAAAKVANDLPDGMRIVTISGNHDMYTTPRFGEPKGTAVTYLAELCPKFQVFDDLSLPVGKKTALFGIPYYDHKGEYDQALDLAVKDAEASYSKDTMKILVIHQTPEGIYNTHIPRDTDPNDPRYDHFDLVLCGHIHTRQYLTDKFVVVGTPIHRTLEDEGEEKGYFVVDIGTSAKGKSAQDIMEFIPTGDRYPQFRVVQDGMEAAKYPDDFVMVKPPKAMEFKTKSVSVEDFGAGAKPSEMVEAYCREVAKDDPNILKIGMKLLQG